jgi:hypothetical protein
MKRNIFKTSVLCLKLLTFISISVEASTQLPKSASCDLISRVIHYSLNECSMNPTEIPLLVSDGQCHVSRVTTPLDFPNQVRAEIQPIISRTITHLEENYKEMVTQPMYDIQLQEGFDRVEYITSQLHGQLNMTIEGVVDDAGNVPIRFDGFTLEAVGKMRQSVAKIYMKMRVSDIVIHGQYNIYTGQLFALPEFTKQQVVVTHDVSIPFVFKVLKEITPKIVLKLQEEVENLANKIVKAIGVDMTYELPVVVQHHASINPAVIVPIKALQDKKPGTSIRYQISGDKYRVKVTHDTHALASMLIPFCPTISL